jgi:HJR/Mrr/RecB family endonuclease
MDIKETFLTASDFFIGRNAEFQRLDELIRRNRHRFTPIVITGLAGIGKTLFLKVFTDNYLKNSKNNREVKWLSLYSSPNPESIIDEFLIELRVNSSAAPTIVVLDDAEGIINRLPEISRKLFNYKRIENIIVTTRPTSAIEKLDRIEKLYLTSLPIQDASELLKKLSLQNLSEEDAKTLAEKVGSFPLALKLLGSLLRTYSPQQLNEMIKRELYNLDSITETKTSRIIKVVQPQLIVTNSNIIEELKKFPEEIYKVTPRKFEEIIAEILSDMGCEVELTQATKDGGKDILAYVNTDFGKLLCLVETKHYRKDRTIGVDIVRNLYGTFCDYEANSAMLVTTSKFSPDARQFQQRHKYQLSLKDYTDIASWILKYKTK